MLYQFLLRLYLTQRSGLTQKQYVERLSDKLESYDQQVEFYNQYMETKKIATISLKNFIDICIQDTLIEDIIGNCTVSLEILKQGNTPDLSERCIECKKNNIVIRNILFMAKNAVEKSKETAFTVQCIKNNVKRNWDYIITNEETRKIITSLREYLSSLNKNLESNASTKNIYFSLHDTDNYRRKVSDDLTTFILSHTNILDLKNKLNTDILNTQYNLFKKLEDTVQDKQNYLAEMTIWKADYVNPYTYNVKPADPIYLRLKEVGFQAKLKTKLTELFTIFYDPIIFTDELNVQNKVQLFDAQRTIEDYIEFFEVNRKAISDNTTFTVLDHTNQASVNIVSAHNSNLIDLYTAVEYMKFYVKYQAKLKQELELSVIKSEKLLWKLKGRKPPEKK